MPDSTELRPGFVVLHGNRIEDLADVALDWLARHPLGPLDEEALLVPSSGMAEWLKGAMAARLGVAAGFRIELPARFVWRAWRAVLGPQVVPKASPLDKAPLTWRLMRLLPALAPQATFAPIAGFLAGDDTPLRRLSLARRLADLFDQYQVYRPDWLDDWAADRDRLARMPGDRAALALPPGQRWQPALWRALLDELGGADAPGSASRPRLHQRFIAALQALPVGSPLPGLPPRLLLFGTTHLPHTALEALGALARHIPVLLAVPDPCRHPWADAPADAELAHPLLQAWGRQCRDFVRQLQVFDEGPARARQLGITDVALFDDAAGPGLLAQLQSRIRDLVPADEPAAPWLPGDRSVVFHEAHGPMREVEVLHDQLLEALAQGSLEPREVVVMVPDIERFAPAIAAVFGRFAPGHPRHVPWGLADRRERGRHPLLRALEALLEVRERRWGVSELRDLLSTTAVAARLGLDSAQTERAAAWMTGAGARWGLHEAQRAALGLQAAGAVGTWRFALDRLLMGYATGPLAAEAEPLGAIDPWPEVAGLESALAGTLAQWFDRIDAWWVEAAQARPPSAWLSPLRRLLGDMFRASDDRERSLLAQLDEALQTWVQACADAGFDEPVGLELVREVWLEGVDEAAGGRFRAGGVTFCTLLPLRAIPFRWVCLLGMNDGEYPRPASRSDFDLMAEPGLARAGDRSRRDDDRQLMLDALLAARERLYISWSGHSARDNQARPPSVLVAQLRDQIAALWGQATLKDLTVSHPLQPFSRRYIEADGDPRLFTHAHEWRELHESVAAADADASLHPVRTQPACAPSVLTLRQLADFVRHPVAAHFRERLRVDLRLRDEDVDDDEPFGEGGLAGWQWRDELLQAVQPAPGERAPPSAAWSQRLARAVERLRRQGRLPWAGPGHAVADQLLLQMQPVLLAWGRWLEAHEPTPDVLALSLRLDDLTLEAGSLPVGRTVDGQGVPQRLLVSASRLARGRQGAEARRPRADRLLPGWLQQLALAACGQPCGLTVLGPDLEVQVDPLDGVEARAQLLALARAWRDGVGDSGPWPTVLDTGLAWLAEGDARARLAYESTASRRGDDQEPHLARCFADFDSLRADPRFEHATRTLYEPLQAWLQTLRVAELAGALAVGERGEDGDG